MANIKISQLSTFTGSVSGAVLVMNNSSNTETFKVDREFLLNGYATVGSNYFNGDQIVTGSIIATSFTGSLLGTSLNSLTASYVNPLRQDVQITGSLDVSNYIYVGTSRISTSAPAPGYGLIFNGNPGYYESIAFTTPTQTTADTGVKFVFSLGGRNYLFNNNLSDFMITGNASNSFLIGVGTTVQFAKFGNGNVSIGTNPVSSSYKFQVIGSGSFTNGLDVTGSLGTTGSLILTGSFNFSGSTNVISRINNSVIRIKMPDINVSGSGTTGVGYSHAPIETPMRFGTSDIDFNTSYGANNPWRPYISFGRHLGPGIAIYEQGNNYMYGMGQSPYALQFYIPGSLSQQFTWVGNGFQPITGDNELMRLTNAGNLSLNSTSSLGYRFYVNGTSLFGNNSVISGSFTVVTGSGIEFQVTNTGTKLGNIITDTHTITGSVNISGSVNIVSALTASTALISGSGTQCFIVVGSGSAQPIFTVQGSQGELFSVTDSLSGSLFSVNDISGLPILEVFSDNTTLMGNYLAPSLNTTNRVTTTNSGSFTIYSVPTSSYDGMFMEYTAKSGSAARAGTFMAIWSGSSVNYTDNSTTDFGNTSALMFTGSISGSNMVITGNVTTGSGWIVKAIIRSI